MKKEVCQLSRFHPLVAKWFSERIGTPTDVQAQSWPGISKGRHVLITAPTGSGKTLTAFLWALDELITGKRVSGFTTLLYVSPLKALNNDIQRNLIQPLLELREVFESAGEPFPDIRALTRSGDTPQDERRRQQRRPPEILITTPESLNLMLSSVGGRSMLTGISTVILDEIHAVFGSRRGTYLMTAVERLVRLSGEFQRIALSATIRPLDKVAAFIGGYSVQMTGSHPVYSARPVSVIESKVGKNYELKVFFPEEAAEQKDREDFWKPFADAFRRIIDRNRSTLLFTNSRRLAEKITLIINNEKDESVAYAHHGSLSREIREVVESRLKTGELKAIVATSSLEMGIDIGSLDEVVLIQSPFSISSAVQRLGRAGHQVGEVSRGTLIPTHSRDFISAAVLTRSVMEQDIEAIEPVMCPLDVLAQCIISMTAMETWDLDELYAFVKACYSYHELSREVFDSVMEMLAGRYAESRIRELRPRISIDRLDNTAAARNGALQLIYMCGGVIPDRGYFHMRHIETGARIGELDEEFVWENPEGSIFTLGTQSWKVERITHNDVLVSPSKTHGPLPPFWKGESFGRDFHYSTKIGQFLEEAGEHLRSGAVAELMAELQQKRCMDAQASRELVDCLVRQKKATGCDLPHRHHLVIEYVDSGPSGAPVHQTVLHTLWGGRVNRPFAMALQASWIEQFGYSPEVYASDDSIIVISTHEVCGDEILSMVSPASFLSLLRRQLEKSGFFGARFRECARRALLVTPNKMNQRMPLWLSRLRSQTLLNAVRKYDDFPILLETWRTCLHDEFDIESLSLVLSELESGIIRHSEVHTTHASPFAQTVTWEQINIYMYREDQPASGDPSKLRDDLIRSVVFAPGFRPPVSAEIIREFERKRMRLAPGYSPATSRDLIDWVKERLIIPEDEWNTLIDAIVRDHGKPFEELAGPVMHKLVRISLVSHSLIAAVETLPKLITLFYGDDKRVKVEPFDEMKAGQTSGDITIQSGDTALPEAGCRSDSMAHSAIDESASLLLGEWLQFYGPRPSSFAGSTLGISRADHLLEELIDGQKLITGNLVTHDERDMICDSENFETLLKMTRTAAIPSFEPLGIERLSLFLAHYHGLTHPQNDIDGVYQALSQLSCYPVAAEMWESDILPARVPLYSPSWLDSLMLEGEFVWIGDEQRRIVFCFRSDIDMLQVGKASEDEMSKPEKGEEAPSADSFFPEDRGRYDFQTLERFSGLDPARLNAMLWEGVWSGRVSNDTFMVLRRGILSNFQAPGLPDHSQDSAADRRRRRGREHGPTGRSRAERHKAVAAQIGSWYHIGREAVVEDILLLEEQKKERVRLLLDRYGILFRELLQREYPAFRWSSLFRTLRLMELSGEVLAGCFFNGIPGPQFISPRAFRIIQRNLPDNAIYAVNAMDPLSLCGIQLDSLKGTMPRRIPGTHCVYRGTHLVMISERNGSSVTFNVDPHDPDIYQILSPLRQMLARSFQPLHRITLETINGADAAGSGYRDCFHNSFEVEKDFRHLVLYRRRS